MTSRSRLLYAGLAAFVAGVAVLLLLARDELGSQPSATTASGREAPARNDAASPIEIAATPAPDDAKRSLATPPASSGAVWRLRLDGLHTDVAWTTPIAIRWQSAPDARGLRLEHADEQVPVHGRVEFRLPDWVQMAMAKPVLVAARDPNYLIFDLHDFLPPVSLDEEYVVYVEVRARVTGRVVDEQGRGIAGARVVAFAEQDGAPSGDSLCGINTRSDGTFALQAPPAVPLVFVAVAMRTYRPVEQNLVPSYEPVRDAEQFAPGLLGASITRPATLGQGTELPPFVLVQTAAITGRVRHDDGAAVAGEVALRTKGGVCLQLDERCAFEWFPNGVVAPMLDRTVRLVDGCFTLQAVPGMPTTVALESLDDAVCLDALPQRTVAAPADLELSLRPSCRLRVLHGGAPVPAATIDLDRDGMARETCTTDARGELRLIGQKTVRVRARGAGSGSPRREVDLAAERDVVLELDRTLTRVTLSFEGDTQVFVVRLRFVRRDGVEARLVAANTSGDGHFVAEVDPGSYRVHLGDFGTPTTGDFLLPQQFDLEVGTEPVERRLTPRFGGIPILTVRDAQGNPVGGTCRVLGSSGEIPDLRFHAFTANRWGSGAVGELLAAPSNTLSSALPAGDYTLQFDFGARGRIERAMRIDERRVTEILVQLP